MLQSLPSRRLRQIADQVCELRKDDTTLTLARTGGAYLLEAASLGAFADNPKISVRIRFQRENASRDRSWCLHSGVWYDIIAMLVPRDAGEDALAWYQRACSVVANVIRNEAEKAEQGERSGAIDSVPRQPPIKEVEPRLTVQKWSNLGIGIDATGNYLAVSPCPERNAVFPREKAVTLDLPGKRWKALFDLLARSEHGNSAKQIDVMTQLGYLKRGEISPDEMSELAEDSHLMNVLKTGKRRLTQAIADLGRKLRRQVEGPKDKGSPAVLSAAGNGHVEAGFVVRHLVPGRDGKLRFGEEP